MTDTLLEEVDGLSTQVRKLSSVNVNSKTIKETTKALAIKYFQETRPQILSLIVDEQELEEIDQVWQDLFKVAHSNNKKSTYLKSFKKLHDLAMSIRLKTIKGRKQEVRLQAFSNTEALIIETLSRMVPSAEESYRQGMLDLNASQGRLSYRGTASEFREALREVLDSMAPDDAVEADASYQREQGRNGPTMKQKVTYILKTRGRNRTQLQAPRNSLDAIESILGSLARSIYDRASLSSHASTSKLEVTRLKNYLDAVLVDILELPQ